MSQDKDLDGLRAKETLGEKVVAFLQSDVGRYLTERAATEERDALEKLATVEPTDSKLIREIQNEAWRANSFVGWLQEAVNDAVSAHITMGEREPLPGSEGEGDA